MILSRYSQKVTLLKFYSDKLIPIQYNKYHNPTKYLRYTLQLVYDKKNQWGIVYWLKKMSLNKIGQFTKENKLEGDKNGELDSDIICILTQLVMKRVNIFIYTF